MVTSMQQQAQQVKKLDRIKDYVNNIKDIEKKFDIMMKKPDTDVDIEYNDLIKAGKIHCNDKPDKRTKIQRVLSINDFPGSDISFRPVKVTKAMLDTIADDWDYSHKNDKEVIRAFCYDKSKNETLLGTTRYEGGAVSVAIPEDACQKDFGVGIDKIGSVHTHPPQFDKPLQSLGDVLHYGGDDTAMFDCTATAWGISCLHRAKEPVIIFNVPQVDANGDPQYDADGKLLYDVKSDIVDWERTMRFSKRDVMDNIFIVSLGNLDEKLTKMLMHSPYFKPMNTKMQLLGRVEAPFKFGKDKSKPKHVKNLYCESFMDIVGRDAKIRTVCDDAKPGDNFYAESGIKPTMIPLYSETGFPTNVYVDDDIAFDVERIKIKKENSKFWDYSDKTREGYHETASERDAKLLGKSPPPVETIKSGALIIKRGKDNDGKRKIKRHCEYILLTNPSYGIEGKPAGVLCRDSPKMATDDTCVVM